MFRGDSAGMRDVLGGMLWDCAAPWARSNVAVGAAGAQVTSTGEGAWQTEHVVCMRRCECWAVQCVDVDVQERPER
jgi:hypothetical protein